MHGKRSLAYAIQGNSRTDESKATTNRKGGSMSELFQIEETKSLRLQWMDFHGVRTSEIHSHNPNAAWKAEAAGHDVFGPTEDAAIVELAKKMGIKLWNEQ